ncbi:MAG: serine O-acetyltransferase [Cytophagales bacterium]
MKFQIPEAFKSEILAKHKNTEVFPATSLISQFVTGLILTLFPQQSRSRIENTEQLDARLEKHFSSLVYLLNYLETQLNQPVDEIAVRFMEKIPDIYASLTQDVEIILKGDPAAKSEFEVVRTYPGFYAIAFYRVAHELHVLDIPLIPRIITEYAHSKTGIDIHPGATIAPSFFIDHGTGITIGETAILGENVKLYQGVTLGALSVAKELANQKRHPTIENNVVIYSGATILGGNTVVGHHSIIGGNVWLTKSVPPHSKVYHKEQTEFKTKDSSLVSE